jgi:hypothetical protein
MNDRDATLCIARQELKENVRVFELDAEVPGTFEEKLRDLWIRLATLGDRIAGLASGCHATIQTHCDAWSSHSYIHAAACGRRHSGNPE